MKNTATIAYERIGASVSNKVMDDELVYYSQLVSEVNACVAAQCALATLFAMR